MERSCGTAWSTHTYLYARSLIPSSEVIEAEKERERERERGREGGEATRGEISLDRTREDRTKRRGNGKNESSSGNSALVSEGTRLIQVSIVSTMKAISRT